MSNPNNKSLNDLFRAARDEANPELISDREAEQLLVNSGMRSLPTKQTIGQQLYELLFSTPLKIGITTMTTATCIALGIFAFWPQSATNNSLASQGTNKTYGTYESNQSHGVADSPNSLLLTKNNQPQTFHRAEALLTTQVAPIATADSLHPIELSPEQLAQLGIVLEDNGDIDFYTKSKTTSEVNKFGLPPSWGVRLHLGEKISDDELAGVRIPASAPRLVTALNGAKRLFSFESDTTITNLIGNRSMIMTMHDAVNIAPGHGDSSQHIVKNQMIVKMFGDSSIANGTDARMKIFVNKEVNVRSSSNDVEQKAEKLSGDTLPHWPNNTVDMSTDDETSVEVETDSTIPNQLVQYTISSKNTLNPKGNIKVDLSPGLNVRVTRKGDTSGLPGLDMSKIAKADSAVRGIELIMKDINVADSRLNLDSALSAARATLKIAEKQVRDHAKALNENDMRIEDSAERAAFWARDLAASNSITLDHLIPIRVRNTKNAAHPNELIFWYEPTPEVTAAIPEASVSMPSQSKQLAISVYPNPTNGPANIHFDLAGAPKAHFSIRNLLGQEVLDGGATSGSSADMKLDLSSLEAGVYLLVTTTDDGERDVERVVVAK